jgi:hypothetical protein
VSTWADRVLITVTNEKRWEHRIKVVRPARRKKREKHDQREVDPKIDYKDLDRAIEKDK